MEHNPFLKPGAPGARGAVEKRANIEWQHRAEPPSEFENRLGDALEQIFGSGIDQLSQVVDELNKSGNRDRAGKPWTEESFQAEMKRLGA
jgi:thymidylate synthase